MSNVQLLSHVKIDRQLKLDHLPGAVVEQRLGLTEHPLTVPTRFNRIISAKPSLRRGLDDTANLGAGFVKYECLKQEVGRHCQWRWRRVSVSYLHVCLPKVAQNRKAQILCPPLVIVGIDNRVQVHLSRRGFRLRGSREAFCRDHHAFVDPRVLDKSYKRIYVRNIYWDGVVLAINGYLNRKLTDGARQQYVYLPIDV